CSQVGDYTKGDEKKRKDNKRYPHACRLELQVARNGAAHSEEYFFRPGKIADHLCIHRARIVGQDRLRLYRWEQTMIFCHDLVIFRLTAMIFCFQKRVLRSIFKTYASCLLMKRLLLLLFVLPNCFVCGQDLRHGLDSLLARIEMLPDTDTA